MTCYKVELTATAEKQLRKVPKQDRLRIVPAMQSLATDPRPHGVRKMYGEQDVYRIRVGKYRVIYEIIDQRLVVIVLKIGHRKDVYRG